MGGFLRWPTLWFTERATVRRLFTEHRLGRRFAARFVAGDTLQDAIRVAGGLRASGIRTMLNHLGEEVASPAQAAAATDAYVRGLKRIHEHPEIDANVSVKLTQLGLDVSTELCRENMERVLQAASGTLVMIDMESRHYVDRTIDVYLGLRDRFTKLGICLQAALHRTWDDVPAIGRPGAIVRMCKGAYLEPPEAALQGRREIRRAYAHLTATLVASGATVHVATHDRRLVEGAASFVRERGLSKDRYEFQMLYGIRRDLQAALVARDEPVRVYVPYGTEWYPYLTRRLAERPGNIWFFASNALRRAG
jgi:proline dehydrogenase